VNLSTKKVEGQILPSYPKYNYFENNNAQLLASLVQIVLLFGQEFLGAILGLDIVGIVLVGFSEFEVIKIFKQELLKRKKLL
jgi:hypothetical protein